MAEEIIKQPARTSSCAAGRVKSFLCGITSLGKFSIGATEKYLSPLAMFWARIYIANVFWKSGQTKITNLDSAAQLFEWEYIPKWEENSKNIFGLDLSWTVPDPAFAAKLATYAEIGLPILLLFGLGTRFGAIGLLGMAITIELFIYPGTSDHYFWMVILLLIITHGPGKLSIDHFIRKRLESNVND